MTAAHVPSVRSHPGSPLCSRLSLAPYTPPCCSRSPGRSTAQKYSDNPRPFPAPKIPGQPEPPFRPHLPRGLHPAHGHVHAASTANLFTLTCLSAAERSSRPSRLGAPARFWAAALVSVDAILTDLCAISGAFQCLTVSYVRQISLAIPQVDRLR